MHSTILAQGRDLDAIFVPVGGGGLIAGVAGYVKALNPGIKIIGVEPFDADAMYRSRQAGQRVVLDRVGIFADGDIVLIRYQETAENGQMVAARIEDENAVTLKKFYKEGNRVKLQPANVTMDPIYVDAANVRIQGRVVGVLRSMF